MALLVLLHMGIMIDNNSIMLGDTDLIRQRYPHIKKLRGKQTDLTCVNTKEGRQYITGCVADQQFFHLNAKDSWEGMLGCSTKKMTLSEKPLLVAIQLHHVHAAVHMRHVELLPALLGLA